MKAGRSLSDLAAEIERQKSSKKDMVDSTENVRVSIPEEGGMVMRLNTDLQGGRFPIRHLAQRQITEHLKIPAKFVDHLWEQPRAHILEHTINELFKVDPQRRLIRVLDGQVRGFLSDRYNRIDHFDVMTHVLPIIAEEGMKIESCEVTERRLYIQARSERLQDAVKVGDEVQAGVLISNSEIGFGAVTIKPMIYRLVCTNGLVLPFDGYSKYHVGRKLEDQSLDELLSDETKALEDKTTLLKIRDLLQANFKPEVFQRRVKKMRDAADNARDTKDVEKRLEILSDQHQIGDGDRSGIMRHLIEGGDLSQWGFVNAITRHAEDVKNYDYAVELEQVGGKVLDLAPAQWARLED